MELPGQQSTNDSVNSSFRTYLYSNSKSILAIYVTLVAIFIYLPVITIIPFSFNSGGVTFPFTGFTWNWYSVLLSDSELFSAFVTSIKISTVTMLIATPIATMVGLAYRREFRGKYLILYLLILGIVIPGITYGLGASLFLNGFLNLEPSWWLAVTVEVVWTVPFGVIIMIVGLPSNLLENDQSAKLMGASLWVRLKEITLPQIWSTILGAALFSFTLAYNESTRNFLIVGSNQPLASKIFSIATRQRPTPELYALGTTTTVISILLLIFALLLVIGQRSTP